MTHGLQGIPPVIPRQSDFLKINSRLNIATKYYKLHTSYENSNPPKTANGAVN